LVGINDYRKPGADLSGCVNDVQDMANTFVICGFKPGDILICTDRRARLSKISSTLISYLSEFSIMIVKEQTKMVGYRVLVYSVLVLATAALIAEMLPEVEAKMIVLPVLLLIIATCTIDIYRLRKGTSIEQEER
jgi:hypothetical protein